MATAMAAGADAVPTKEISVLLFNVSNGSAGNVEGLADDQVEGIKAVLSSKEVLGARNLFVLASADQGQLTADRKNTLSEALPSDKDFDCNENVGIFQRSEQPKRANFRIPFVEKDDRVSFAIVEVPFEEGNVNILLVSYHAQEGMLAVKEFERLIDQCKKMKEETNYHAVIIGGDFKLSLGAAREAVEKANRQKVLHYAPNDPEFQNSTHFVVYWPDTYLDVVHDHPKLLQWIDEPFGKISQGYKHVISLASPDRQSKLEPFDHPRLLFKFTVRGQPEKSDKASVSSRKRKSDSDDKRKSDDISSKSKRQSDDDHSSKRKK